MKPPPIHVMKLAPKPDYAPGCAGSLDFQAMQSCLAPSEILAKTSVDAGDSGTIFGVVLLPRGVVDESSSPKSLESGVSRRNHSIWFC